MPIYTYQCEECGVRFDARQKFTDNALMKCPECGGHVHRIPQAVGIVFKGSGWYVTDSKGRNNLAVPPKKEDADDTKPADSKSADAAPGTTTSASSADNSTNTKE
jgi:putative FmdB family regulatory protein